MKTTLTVSLALASCALAMHAIFFATQCTAGTVTVDTVIADKVQVREIGWNPPQDKGILYYSFSSDEGTTVTDESSSENDGVASGCTWTNADVWGGAMFFDGIDDKISVSSAPNFPAWNQYSVSVWFRHNGGGDFGAGYGHKIVDKTSMYHDWHIRLYHTTGTLAWWLYEDGKTIGLGAGSSNYMDNIWHHVVAIRDTTNGQFWVDGVLKSERYDMRSVLSSSDFCVGNSLSTDSYQRKSWSGNLDEVRVFDRSLLPSDVTNLYDNGLCACTNPSMSISVSTNLAVHGALSVSGRAMFPGGVVFSRPLGDLSCGTYTNTP